MSTRDETTTEYAFPLPVPCQHGGMTIRDFFAAHIVAGMVSGALWNEVDTEDAARIAFEIADEMMKARAK